MVPPGAQKICRDHSLRSPTTTAAGTASTATATTAGAASPVVIVVVVVVVVFTVLVTDIDLAPSGIDETDAISISVVGTAA